MAANLIETLTIRLTLLSALLLVLVGCGGGDPEYDGLDLEISPGEFFDALADIPECDVVLDGVTIIDEDFEGCIKDGVIHAGALIYDNCTDGRTLIGFGEGWAFAGEPFQIGDWAPAVDTCHSP